jgi:hypothetical protein
VNHRAPAVPGHVRDHLPRTEEGTLEVHVHVLVELLGRDSVKLVAAEVTPGVVDEDVDPVAPLDCLFDEPCHVFGSGDVCPLELRLVTIGGELLDCLGPAVLVDVRDSHQRSFLGDPPCDRSADSRRRTGDDRRQSAEPSALL